MGEKESYAYDLNNQLAKRTRPDGDIITYDYNKLDELLTTDYSAEADGTVLYAYDPEGKRVSMSDLTGTSTYEYDEDGRITGVQQGDGSVILYSYDSYGNLSKLIYPDGTAVQYEYDALDRLVKVTDRTGGKTTYNAAHQVSEVQNLDAKKKKISDYKYTYDLSGYILSEEIATEEGTKVQSYGYDSAGQRTDVVTTDKKGNQIRSLEADEKVVEYTYDTENHLIAVTDDDGLLMAALYDGDDNRMFTAGRTEDTKEYQLFRQKKSSPKTSVQGKEGSLFWYGFGQNFLQASGV